MLAPAGDLGQDDASGQDQRTSAPSRPNVIKSSDRPMKRHAHGDREAQALPIDPFGVFGERSPLRSEYGPSMVFDMLQQAVAMAPLVG
jgi:hypothetical protein